MNSRQDKFPDYPQRKRKSHYARMSLHLALGLSAAFAGLGLTPFHSTNAHAAKCKNPDALGVHREIAVSRKNGFHLGGGKTGGIGLRPGELVITFDDGPRPGITDPILKALERECVKATFFMLGRAARSNPGLTKRVAREGHTIATHTQSHPFLTRHGNEKVAAELRRGWNSVNAALKGTPYKSANFFRYPYLDRSKRTDAVVRKTGMVVFDVHIDSLDWKKTSPEAMRDRLLNRVRQRGSGVILFHDIQKKTAKMLPQILRTLKAEGYKIVHTVPAQRNFKFGKFSALPDIVPAVPRIRPEPTQLASVGSDGPVTVPQSTSVNFQGYAPELSSKVIIEETNDTLNLVVDAVPEKETAPQIEKVEVSAKEEALSARRPPKNITSSSEVEAEEASISAEGPSTEKPPVLDAESDPKNLTEIAGQNEQTSLTEVALTRKPTDDADNNPLSESQQIKSAKLDDTAVVEIEGQKKNIDLEQTQSIVEEKEEAIPSIEASTDGAAVVAALGNLDPQTNGPALEEASHDKTVEGPESEENDRTAVITPFPKARIGPRIPLPVKRPAFSPRKQTVATTVIPANEPNDALRAVVGSTLLRQDEAETVSNEDKKRGGFLGIFRPFSRD